MKTIRLLVFVAISVAFSNVGYAAYAYKDADSDGWASTLRIITDAQIPAFEAAGWLTSATRPPAFDCNDADNTVWERVQLWVDNDGDLRATGYEIHCVGNTLPAGRIRAADKLASTDCNDADPTAWRTARIFPDVDGDKWTGGVSSVVCIGNVPAGFVIQAEVLGYADCDDNNASIWHKFKLYADADGDMWGSGTPIFVCLGNTIPPGYVTDVAALGIPDCNDADPTVWRTVGLLFDNDGDNYVIINTPLTNLCIGTNPPAKYIFPANRLGISDCDDNNPNAWRSACAKPIGALGPNITVCIPGLIMPPGYEECIRPEAEEIITFSVYPNPATDRVYMMPEQDLKEKVEVKLMDAYGRVIRMVSAPNAIKGQNLSINTGDLKPGLYRIAIQSGNTIVSKTIAVKL